MEMLDFITVMRAKRQLEMKNYLDKGYEIQDKKRYIMLEKIELPYMGTEYEYSVQITQDEVYFYINKNGGNIYLSIPEIYQLVRKLNQVDGGYMSRSLNKQLKQSQNKKTEFTNNNLTYKIARPVEIEKCLEVKIPQTGICVTNVELFLLILLIQEKSNAWFRKSKDYKKQYANGILRLLIVLTEYKNDDMLLSSLGWKWNSETEIFDFDSPKSQEGRERYKYYLTRGEFTAKMQTKKS